MPSGIYERFFANLMNKEIDLEIDVVKVALLNNSHSFYGADNLWSEVSANEISGTGYSAGGKTLAGKAVTQATITKWDGNNVLWTSAVFSAYHAVIYSGTDLIASIDFGGIQSVADGNFEIEWSADGIITLTEN